MGCFPSSFARFCCSIGLVAGRVRRRRNIALGQAPQGGMGESSPEFGPEFAQTDALQLHFLRRYLQ
jgi:hypothetical protein